MSDDQREGFVTLLCAELEKIGACEENCDIELQKGPIIETVGKTMSDAFKSHSEGTHSEKLQFARDVISRVVENLIDSDTPDAVIKLIMEYALNNLGGM